MEVKERKTFKDVHKELENEHIFLLKNHDLKGFKDKANFLKTIGLTNSIATKIYSGIIEKTLRADGEYIKSEDLKSLLEELDSVKQCLKRKIKKIRKRKIKKIKEIERKFLVDVENPYKCW